MELAAQLLQDAERTMDSSQTALEFFNAMFRLYPTA
jgi:hypothetical protein